MTKKYRKFPSKVAENYKELMEAIHEKNSEYKRNNAEKRCIDQLSQLIQATQGEIPRMATKNPNTLYKELIV